MKVIKSDLPAKISPIDKNEKSDFERLKNDISSEARKGQIMSSDIAH